MNESDGHHQNNCRDCRGLPATTTQGDNMGKVKKALEGRAKMEDTKIMDIDSKINALQVERTFHVGLHTAYINSLAELEKSEKDQDFIDMRTNQDRV